MSPNERIHTIRPVCESCNRCDGFIGPQKGTVVCVKLRISLCAERCPHGYWDASNIAIPPVIYEQPTGRHRRKKRLLPGPGDYLKAFFAVLGFHATPGCGCERMRRRMNEYGWETCLGEQRDHIIKFVQIQGERSGKALTESTILNAFNQFFPSKKNGKGASARRPGAADARAV